MRNRPLSLKLLERHWSAGIAATPVRHDGELKIQTHPLMFAASDDQMARAAFALALTIDAPRHLRELVFEHLADKLARSEAYAQLVITTQDPDEDAKDRVEARDDRA